MKRVIELEPWGEKAIRHFLNEYSNRLHNDGCDEINIPRFLGIKDEKTLLEIDTVIGHHIDPYGWESAPRTVQSGAFMADYLATIFNSGWIPT